jgi:hypothetical protein
MVAAVDVETQQLDRARARDRGRRISGEQLRKADQRAGFVLGDERGAPGIRQLGRLPDRAVGRLEMRGDVFGRVVGGEGVAERACAEVRQGRCVARDRGPDAMARTAIRRRTRCRPVGGQRRDAQ